MQDAELKCFRLLKSDIPKVLRGAYPDTPADIALWKGQQINAFQADLARKVKGRVSEKWFYTHMKSDQGTLPRTDILDMLCQYVGYRDWGHYTQAKKPAAGLPPRQAVLAVLVLGLSGFALYYVAQTHGGPEKRVRFCLVNAYSKTAVLGKAVDVLVLRPGESPRHALLDEGGCFWVSSTQNKVVFVVKSGYFHPDTIRRVLYRGGQMEEVMLQPNDYAHMIHLFAAAKVGDWQARRQQLQKMFAPQARIYQLYDSIGLGMELYNREDFIDKLTTPAKSLGKIKVLETHYEGGQITRLRFMQSK